MTSVAATVAAACQLAACVGPLVPVSTVDDATAADLTANIAVYEASNTPTTAVALAPITATSCKNKMWDPDASDADAINQLRLFARQHGGDAVGNLVCQAPRGTELVTNCWASITCTGTAIRARPTSTPPRRGASSRKG